MSAHGGGGTPEGSRVKNVTERDRPGLNVVGQSGEVFYGNWERDPSSRSSRAPHVHTVLTRRDNTT